jgi:hypothetical protein
MRLDLEATVRTRTLDFDAEEIIARFPTGLIARWVYGSREDAEISRRRDNALPMFMTEELEHGAVVEVVVDRITVQKPFDRMVAQS